MAVTDLEKYNFNNFQTKPVPLFISWPTEKFCMFKIAKLLCLIYISIYIFFYRSSNCKHCMEV